MNILEKVILKDWTWWKIGGPADYFCLPQAVEEVREAVTFAHAKGLSVTVLGGGTNVLVSDQGVAGLVICLKNLLGLSVTERDERLHLQALAGTPKSELTRIFLQRKLAPAIFLCGVPGEVGGGVAMNAGIGEAIVPREFVEITDWVEFLDLDTLEICRREKRELSWKYRSCSGWQPGVIVNVGMSWPLIPEADVQQRVKDATKERLRKQPLELPSCGSVFKNPPNASAGALIERAGLKGLRYGGAEISSKHANFIVNVGGATAADVDHLIHQAKAEVLRQCAVTLETEVRYIGRWMS